MEIKLFEVRDRMTCISCIGIRLGSRNEAERWLLGRVGYGLTTEEQDCYVAFGGLENWNVTTDPYGHDTIARTYHQAHKYVQVHWEELQSGDVIDVEYTLGEKPTKKESERYA